MNKSDRDKDILIGRSDNSVSLLLDTPSESSDFMIHSLKACVIAATMGPDALARTVKVVATNMIACNKIDEGVQLLCLIGKGLDACRYTFLLLLFFYCITDYRLYWIAGICRAMIGGMMLHWWPKPIFPNPNAVLLCENGLNI